MITLHLQETDTPTPRPTDTETPPPAGTDTGTPSPTLEIPQALYAVSTLSSGQPYAVIYTTTVGESELVAIDTVILILLIVGIYLLMRVVKLLDRR
jgi:hypothetical protein